MKSDLTPQEQGSIDTQARANPKAEGLSTTTDTLATRIEYEPGILGLLSAVNSIYTELRTLEGGNQEPELSDCGLLILFLFLSLVPTLPLPTQIFFVFTLPHLNFFSYIFLV